MVVYWEHISPAVFQRLQQVSMGQFKELNFSRENYEGVNK